MANTLTPEQIEAAQIARNESIRAQGNMMYQIFTRRVGAHTTGHGVTMAHRKDAGVMCQDESLKFVTPANDVDEPVSANDEPIIAQDEPVFADAPVALPTPKKRPVFTIVK